MARASNNDKFESKLSDYSEELLKHNGVPESKDFDENTEDHKKFEKLESWFDKYLPFELNNALLLRANDVKEFHLNLAFCRIPLMELYGKEAGGLLHTSYATLMMFQSKNDLSQNKCYANLLQICRCAFFNNFETYTLHGQPPAARSGHEDRRNYEIAKKMLGVGTIPTESEVNTKMQILETNIKMAVKDMKFADRPCYKELLMQLPEGEVPTSPMAEMHPCSFTSKTWLPAKLSLAAFLRQMGRFLQLHVNSNEINDEIKAEDFINKTVKQDASEDIMREMPEHLQMFEVITRNKTLMTVKGCSLHFSKNGDFELILPDNYLQQINLQQIDLKEVRALAWKDSKDSKAKNDTEWRFLPAILNCKNIKVTITEYQDIEYQDIEDQDIEYQDIEDQDIEYQDIEDQDIEYQWIMLQGDVILHIPQDRTRETCISNFKDALNGMRDYVAEHKHISSVFSVPIDQSFRTANVEIEEMLCIAYTMFNLLPSEYLCISRCTHTWKDLDIANNLLKDLHMKLFDLTRMISVLVGCRKQSCLVDVSKRDEADNVSEIDEAEAIRMAEAIRIVKLLPTLQAILSRGDQLEDKSIVYVSNCHYLLAKQLGIIHLNSKQILQDKNKYVQELYQRGIVQNTQQKSDVSLDMHKLKTGFKHQLKNLIEESSIKDASYEFVSEQVAIATQLFPDIVWSKALDRVYNLSKIANRLRCHGILQRLWEHDQAKDILEKLFAKFSTSIRCIDHETLYAVFAIYSFCVFKTFHCGQIRRDLCNNEFLSTPTEIELMIVPMSPSNEESFAVIKFLLQQQQLAADQFHQMQDFVLACMTQRYDSSKQINLELCLLNLKYSKDKVCIIKQAKKLQLLILQWRHILFQRSKQDYDEFNGILWKLQDPIGDFPNKEAEAETLKDYYENLFSKPLQEKITTYQTMYSKYDDARIPVTVSTSADSLWVIPKQWQIPTIYALNRLWCWCHFVCQEHLRDKVLPDNVVEKKHSDQIVAIAEAFKTLYVDPKLDDDGVVRLLRIGNMIMRIFQVTKLETYQSNIPNDSLVHPYGLMKCYTEPHTLFSAKPDKFLEDITKFGDLFCLIDCYDIEGDKKSIEDVCRKFYLYTVQHNTLAYNFPYLHYWEQPKTHIVEQIMVRIKRIFQYQQGIIEKTGQLAVNIATGNMQDTYDKQEGDEQEGDKQEGEDGYRTPPNESSKKLGIGTPNRPEGTIPEGTIPEGTIPEGTIPEGTSPEGTSPEGTNLIPGREARASQLLAVHRALEFLDRHHMSQTTPERQTLCFKSRPSAQEKSYFKSRPSAQEKSYFKSRHSAQEKLLHFFRSKPE